MQNKELVEKYQRKSEVEIAKFKKACRFNGISLDKFHELLEQYETLTPIEKIELLNERNEFKTLGFEETKTF